MESYSPYLQVLREAGGQGGNWLCSSGEDEGVCPRCGEKSVTKGEVIVMDWEGNGSLSWRYASNCGCGQSWVEEAEFNLTHRL